MRTVAATNNSSEYRNAGDIRQMLFRAQLAAAGLMVCTILGCQSQPKQAGNPASTVAKSVVAVQTAAEALTVHTPEAEFVLTADGALTATLHKQGTNLTLDKKLIDNGQCVTIGGKEYPRTALDLSALHFRESDLARLCHRDLRFLLKISLTLHDSRLFHCFRGRRGFGSVQDQRGQPQCGDNN